MYRSIVWRIPRSVHGVVFGVCLAACNRSTPPASTTAQDAASMASTQPVVSVSNEAVVKTVRSWCDAWNRHDVVALGNVYDERVRTGRTEFSKVSLLKQREEFFRAEPTYRRDIEGPIAVSGGDGGTVVAQFQDRRGTARRMTQSETTLTLRMRGSALPVVIDEEFEAQASTPPTGPNMTSCAEAAERIVYSLPTAKRAIDEAKRQAAESDGAATFGAMGPIFEGADGLQQELGLVEAGKLQSRVYYAVKHHQLFVKVSDVDQQLSPEAAREIARLCP